MVLENDIEYFENYLKELNVFLYKESLSLTINEYIIIVLETERIRDYIDYLKELKNINKQESEITYKK